MRLYSLLTCVALLTTGCETPLDPVLGAFYGTFSLQSVDGTSLPYLQLDYTYTRQYLIADTLSADGRGHYSRITVTETDSIGQPYHEARRETSGGTYSFRGDTIVFAFNCPPFASCVAPPIGLRHADGSITLAYQTTVGLARQSLFVPLP